MCMNSAVQVELVIIRLVDHRSGTLLLSYVCLLKCNTNPQDWQKQNDETTCISKLI